LFGREHGVELILELLLHLQELLLGERGIGFISGSAHALELAPPFGIQASNLTLLLRCQVEALLHHAVIEGVEALELQAELVKSLADPRVGEGRVYERVELLVELVLQLHEALHALLLGEIRIQIREALIKTHPRLLVGAVQGIELVVVEVELLPDAWIAEKRRSRNPIEVVEASLLRRLQLTSSNLAGGTNGRWGFGGSGGSGLSGRPGLLRAGGATGSSCRARPASSLTAL
jgi:hypothetical protein